MRRCEYGYFCDETWRCPRHRKWPRRSIKKWGRR